MTGGAWPATEPRTAAIAGGRRRFLIALAAALLAVEGCAGGAPGTQLASAPAAMAIHVGNGTPLDVTILVNGQPEGAVAAHSGGELAATGLLALPWSVEARSPSGRVLARMTVAVADAVPFAPDVHTIPMGRVDLSCGRLTIWAGAYPPSGPVAPGPAGSPGDCAP
jgi:hypothetical protein